MWYKDYGEMIFPICAKNGKFNVFGPQPIGLKSTITKKPGLS